MTYGPVRIVPMKKSHIPACSRIASSSEPWVSLRENIDFGRYIARKEAHACMVGSDPVGFLIFTPYPVFARGGYLRALGVASSLRRRGIGKKLMAFAEQTTARQTENFYLCVSSFNRKAQSFYRALGYTKVGSIPELIKTGVSEYIFWKRLSKLPRKTRRR